jgi:hypothetical protein
MAAGCAHSGSSRASRRRGQGVMHQVLGIDVAARERASVAAESRKLAEDVEGGRALKRHDPYTELETGLIR